MKLRKSTLIVQGLIVVMTVCWFIDIFVLYSNPLTVSGLRIGLHYFAEFPLLALGAYKIGKYNVGWTILLLLSIIGFWIATTPLHLRNGYDLYWIASSTLVFITVVLSGTLFATFERRVRQWQ